LSYVIPIIEQVIEYNKEKKIKRGFNEPLALVMVPTRELAFQVYEIFKKFTNNELNFRVVLDLNDDIIMSKEILAGEIIDSKLEDSSNIPADVVITMPNRLRRQLKFKTDYIRANFLQKLVIDEANLLLDDSNNEYILEILNRLELNLKPVKEDGTLNKITNTQLLIVSATIPRDMKKILESILDVSTELEVIKTSRVNKIMMHVPQHFIRLTNSKKTEHLLAIAKNNIHDSIMIFSNKTDTANFVHKFLKENDIKSCLFHSSMKDNERDASIQQFLNGECNIISCTDIASRGLDTLHVKHVVNYEMPTFIADYVHRIGRVGRFGTTVKGAKVTNLITKAFEIDTVWNIENSIRKGVDLDNLNANIKRIMLHRHTPKGHFNKESVKSENREEIKKN
jgi:superfamily II DNA/RNA helicase